MSQKEVVDNVKLLESIEEIMQPVRLEYVQLKRFRKFDCLQRKTAGAVEAPGKWVCNLHFCL